MIPETATAPPSSGVRVWLAAIVPLALLALLLTVIFQTRPADRLRNQSAPPVERLSIGRAILEPDAIVVSVLNDGPDPVTIAQVVVDDAYWAYSAEPGTTLDHLDRARLTIPYPWVEGEAHVLKILTSTGATFEHEIPVAVQTPTFSVGHLLTFTLIGIYVGVIPIALGLMWFPLTRRLGETGLDALLALTVGLLAFLLVDTVHEGLEAAGELPASYQGIALFLAGAAGAYLVLQSFGRWLRARRSRFASSQGWVLAILVAVGIGLHNFGEGLAIGAAYALGEAAFGTLLIVGFTLHNTTEGLAIVAPLARDRGHHPSDEGTSRDAAERRSPSAAALVRLGLIGGVPTIAGACLGGLFYTPLLAVLFLGLGAGAIAQVTMQIAAQIAGDGTVAERFASGPVLTGLVAGFAAMYATGLIVG